MREKISKKLKRLSINLLILLLAFSFMSIVPENVEAGSRRKSSAVKKKRKKKKEVRKRKRRERKKRKKRRSRHRSKKRRSYNPAKTREMTIQIIRENSPEISALAGLNPNLGKPLAKSERTDTLTCYPDDPKQYSEDYDKFMITNREDLMDINSFKSEWLKEVAHGSADDMTEAGIYKQDLMNEIMDWVGTPYLFGGTSRKSIDCSAFTQRVFLNVGNIKIPRTARTQIDVGRPVERNDLEFGDLIFFHTYSMRFPSHVGIYLGDDLFAHASSMWGVTVSSLNKPYYRSHFIGGRRLTVQDAIRLSVDPDKRLTENQ